MYQSDKIKLICCHCGIEMERKDAVVRYLGRSFKHGIPVCPQCGQIYVSKEFSEGKLAELEQMLEDK